MHATESLLQTPFHQMHVDAGGKMVPFAGYSMPVNYGEGIIAEHKHTRDKAGLFDVSHMGQVRVAGSDAAQRLESLIPVDIVSLPAGRQRYGLLTNEAGGIMDDLMIVRLDEAEFMLVVNAACKDADFDHLHQALGDSLDVVMLDDRALLAIQGPTAVQVVQSLGCDVSGMKFMDAAHLELDGVSCLFTRSGYTGEDGFEISMPADQGTRVADALLGSDHVHWVGLGARDSLRLEAGLSLYGHDLTVETTPVEAGLIWAISKSRRAGGPRAGGFPGADVILEQIPDNVDRKLVGLLPEGRLPVREGAIIEDRQEQEIGSVTSGGFSPSLGHPICMGYVATGHAGPESELNAVVRDKRIPLTVTKLPFVPHRYAR